MAEHRRPEGWGQGYYCAICGGHGISMMGSSGHGPGICIPNPELVKKLIQLNSDRVEVTTVSHAQLIKAHSWNRERQNFEKWYRLSIDDLECPMRRNSDGSYKSPYIQNAWMGWRARAKLGISGKIEIGLKP